MASPNEKRFQSHAGSIEAQRTNKAPPITKKSFNPTLVRLRPSFLRSLLLPATLFQSHAGSIEAFSDAVMELRNYSVSIPRWFD